MIMKVVAILLVFGVAIFLGFEIVGLIRDIKARRNKSIVKGNDLKGDKE